MDPLDGSSWGRYLDHMVARDPADGAFLLDLCLKGARMLMQGFRGPTYYNLIGFIAWNT